MRTDLSGGLGGTPVSRRFLCDWSDAPPAGKWMEVRLPFASFAGRYGGTEDARFNAHRVASITLLQNLEDNAEHTLFIDDISSLM